MVAITTNDYETFEATISAPRVGRWYAEVQTLAPLEAGDSVTISDSTTDLVGTVQSGGLAVSRTVARIVGGTGGLSNTMAGKHWSNATAGMILGNICLDLGEAKSNFVDLSISGQVFPFWTQVEGTGGSALLNLANSNGWVWRVLQDGNVWLGDPDVGELATEHQVLEPHPEDRSYDVAPESLELWPGKLQGDSVIQRVEYSLGENLRCTYWV